MISMRRAGNSARLNATWAGGVARHRAGRLAATAAGVALGVALLASLGTFLSASKATMMRRAIENVSVDWQVEGQRDADPAALAGTVAGTKHVVAAETVTFGSTTGLESVKNGTTQTTGAGQVLGIGDTYRTTFPGEFRDLVGASSGALLYQQTAANLSAVPGDQVSVGRAGLPPVTVTIAGVVDIPQADSLFQQVGAPVGAQPLAPPDNLLILPSATWHRLFDPLATTRPDLVHTQVHVRLDHRLPADPSAAYTQVTGQARNLEATLAGSGLVGDNLGATLGGARGDALYAQVLFLFLGVPGAVLAGLLTAGVASSARDRRRREQALLRARGATARQLVRLALFEAAAVGAVGSAAGLALALPIGRLLFGSARFGATPRSALAWSLAAVASGLGIAMASIALPARQDARRLTVASARLTVGRTGNPRWMRWGVDFALLGVALVVFWLTSRNGYNLVLAVEGVPTISVSYWAFAGPALLWFGAGLLSYRLTMLLAGRGRPLVGSVISPLAGGLSDTVAASLQRQRRPIARGAALMALTIGFAASTAVFNATYRQQAEIDAVLTNGADVAVAVSPGTVMSPSSPTYQQILATAQVRHVEPLQHRFAYVGADLQDLYGVDPSTIVTAGRLQDAYFQGGTARALMARLAAQPDGLVVSAETVHDFQLLPGDSVTLRLQDARQKAYVDVPFHYIGVVKEFPTAPRDSFLLANRAYIAKATGSDAIGAFLVDTGGRHVAGVADALRRQLGTTVAVSDVASARKVVGSSLTAVDLNGLSRLELGFALALAAAATGLTLWLGLAERRRTFSIATALGATSRQVGSFVWAEAGVVIVAGLVTGCAAAWALSHMLVKVLRGVFDPRPAHLSVPWQYLLTVVVISVVATAIAAAGAVRSSRSPSLEIFRSL
ncbi:MAG: putative transport system permease protein [Frankiaceae bacterium]|nr:putative transport system permease protein [Frankiaceae bacterium]